jgi:hypothetical protein
MRVSQCRLELLLVHVDAGSSKLLILNFLLERKNRLARVHRWMLIRNTIVHFHEEVML